MPSCMIHLLTAYKYDTKLSVNFLIGNLIPDSISEWKAKDIVHLRNQEDRLNALSKLADSLDLRNDIQLGILLHLFLDYKWDQDPMKRYIDNYSGEHWLLDYRNEIGLASAWLYHHTPWSIQAWDEMVLCPTSLYDNIDGYVKEDIADFITRNGKWHEANNVGPSTSFSPEFIEEFTTKVAIEFNNWTQQYFS